MKIKNHILLALSILFSFASFSQEKGTQEFKLSSGFETSNEFLNTIETIINNASFKNSKSTPALSLTYRIAIKDKWFINSDGVYQNISKEVFENAIRTGNVKANYYTIGLGTDYSYISKKWFQMYSGASIAYTFQNSNFTTTSNIKDSKDSYLNFHVNALGFRFGKKLAAFAEIGIGYKGIANVGISYHF